MSEEKRPEMSAPPAGEALSFADEAASIVSSSSQLVRSLLGPWEPEAPPGPAPAPAPAPSSSSEDAHAPRRKRESTPRDEKDEGYWDKRRKNNEAARRSRDKRRRQDEALERRVAALQRDNARLRAQLLALKLRYGLVTDPAFTPACPRPVPAPHFTPACPEGGCPHPVPARACSEGGCPRPAPAPHFTPACPEGGCPHPAPAPHFTPACSEGGCPRPVPASACLCRARGDRGSLSEDSGFSTPGGSSAGSPVSFGERLSQPGKPRAEPRPCPMQGDGLGGAAGEDMSRGGPGRGDPADAMRSLPHKLRFKQPAGRASGSTVGGDRGWSPTCPIGARDTPKQPIIGHFLSREAVEDGQQSPQPGKVSQLPDSQCQAENHVLHSQLTTLSREIAELRSLFSQQLVAQTS